MTEEEIDAIWEKGRKVPDYDPSSLGRMPAVRGLREISLAKQMPNSGGKLTIFIPRL